jgi:hypothetical protein
VSHALSVGWAGNPQGVTGAEYSYVHLQDFNIMMLKTLFTCGTYVHWRNFMSIWDKINGKRERQGLLVARVPPETFGVPGCRSSWWITLDPAELEGAPPPTASCVLLYLHGKGPAGWTACRTAGLPAGHCKAVLLHRNALLTAASNPHMFISVI